MTYIVAYVEITKDEIGEEIFHDHFKLFFEDSELENATQAISFYNDIRERDFIHSANLCKLMDTTEHYPITAS